MAVVTICSDLGAQENKICHCFWDCPYSMTKGFCNSHAQPFFAPIWDNSDCGFWFKRPQWYNCKNIIWSILLVWFFLLPNPASFPSVPQVWSQGPSLGNDLSVKPHLCICFSRNLTWDNWYGKPCLHNIWPEYNLVMSSEKRGLNKYLSIIYTIEFLGINPLSNKVFHYFVTWWQLNCVSAEYPVCAYHGRSFKIKNCSGMIRYVYSWGSIDKGHTQTLHS